MSDDNDVAPRWKVDLTRRFLAKVKKTPSCHLWTGATDDSGYGVIWFDGRLRRATHVAFFLKHGRWPKPCALHKCDTPACVRLNHLFEGTKQENADDMIHKGRDRKALGEAVGSAKLTNVLVKKIRLEDGSSRIVGKKYGVSHVVIQAIRRGEAWRHV